MFSAEEYQYYSKQILLESVGKEGQLRLKKSRVAIVGAGGLASAASQVLASSGVGLIRIIDGDSIEASNLARQFQFYYEEIGQLKANVLAQKLRLMNPFIRLQSEPHFLNPENMDRLLSDIDIVLDCTDNYHTRYMLSDYTAIKKIPMVYGALHKTEGQYCVLNGQAGPSYRDLFPDELGASLIPNCSEVGVYSILPALIGLYQANETIKIILNHPHVKMGKLTTVNLLQNQHYEIEFSTDKL